MRGGWRIWGLAVALIGLAAYLPVLSARFTSDDFFLLHAVRAGGPLGLWAGAGSDWFRPLVSLSLWADDRWWHGDPWALHAVNLLLHGLCAVLVGVVTAQLLRLRGTDPGAARRTALLAGGFFLVLPSHSEAVSWVSGRTDVLATLFALGAVAAFLRAEGSRVWGAACLLMSALALLSKESTVVLPLVLLVLHLALPRTESRRSRRRALLVGSSLALALSALAVRRLALGTWVGGYGAGVHLNLDPRVPAMNLVLLPLRTLLPYVPLDWLPAGLPLARLQEVFHHALRSRSPIVWLAALGGVTALAALAALAWTVLRRRKIRPTVFAAGAPTTFALAYGVLLLPVLTMRVSLVNTQGERFLYLPSVFLCAWLATLLVRWIRSTAALATVATVLVLLGSAALFGQNRDWRAAGEIYARVVTDLGAMAPGRPIVLLNLPDHLHGAYVFRNGLEEACAMGLGARAPSRITVAVFHTLGAPGDRVLVTRSGPGYAVRLANPRARFLPRDASSLRFAAPPGLREEADGPGGERITFERGDAVTACFSGGRLWRIAGRPGGGSGVDTP
jgi:hypothetical protein